MSFSNYNNQKCRQICISNNVLPPKIGNEMFDNEEIVKYIIKYYNMKCRSLKSCF